MKPPRSTSGKSRRRGYLDGQMLIAMPTIRSERYRRGGAGFAGIASRRRPFLIERDLEACVQ